MRCVTERGGVSAAGRARSARPRRTRARRRRRSRSCTPSPCTGATRSITSAPATCPAVIAIVRPSTPRRDTRIALPVAIVAPMKPPIHCSGGASQPCAVWKPVTTQARISRAVRPTMKLIIPATSGSPVARASCPLAACCRATPTPATTAKASSARSRCARAPKAEIATAAIASTTPAMRSGVAPGAAGGAEPGAVGEQAAGRLAAHDRDDQQRDADLRRGDRRAGHEQRAAEPADQVPPLQRRRPRAPPRRARGSARVTVTSAISASSPIVLLTDAAISPEPSDTAQAAVDVGLKRDPGPGGDGERRRQDRGRPHASFGDRHGAVSRAPSSAGRSSIATRSCSSVSRSRIVTVRSSTLWWSTVTHHGVPISSWRR